MAKSLPNLAQRVITWQRQYGRHDLPWQNTQDPYRIWLSEIMLQQTQVATVIGYFNRFVDRFPDVDSLSNASLEDVLLCWAGLGYYARARHLHACAQQVVALWAGHFPTTAEALQTLPGIGPSTAAAIAAFCFGERTPILDGNVKRVYCRFFGVEGDPTSRVVVQQLWQRAKESTPIEALTVEQPDAMARFTQGLMDLGATCCTRRQPSCERCPLASDCVAKLSGRTNELPQPRTQRVMPERSTIMLLISRQIPDLAHGETCTNKMSADKVIADTSDNVNVLASKANTDVARHNQAVLLYKRPAKGIWGGLWSLPECRLAGDFNITTHQLTTTQLPLTAVKRHAFKQKNTHTRTNTKLITNTSAIESSSKLIVEQWCTKYAIKNPTLLSMAAFRHTFTHFHLHIQPWLVEINDEVGFDPQTADETMQWVRVDQLHRFGMPAPVQNLLLNFTML